MKLAIARPLYWLPYNAHLRPHGRIMMNHERRKPIQILLVEDDPEAIRTIWNMLHEKSRYNFQVEAVTRLPEAIHRMGSLHVDAVLLDLLLVTHQAEMDAVAAINQANPH